MNAVDTQLLNDHAVKWSLSNIKPINVSSSFSNVATVTMSNGEKAVLKVLNEQGADIEQNGAAALGYFACDRIVKLSNHDESAQLLEFIDGPMLTTKVFENGQYNAKGDEEAAHIICDIIEVLHEAPKVEMSHHPFKSLEEQFTALLNYDGRNAILKEAQDLAGHLLDNQQNVTILHGDLHHDNILFSTMRNSWVAIDPHGIKGDKAYEYANAFNYPVDESDITRNPDRIHMLANIFSARSGLDRSRLLGFAAAHMGLSASWRLQQGRERSAKGVLRSCEAVLKLVNK